MVQTLTTKDCKGPQTDMPKNVGSIKTWSAKMKSRRIFFPRVFSACCAILTSPKEGETAVYGYNHRSVLSSFGVVLMSCRVNFHVVKNGTVIAHFSRIFTLKRSLRIFGSPFLASLRTADAFPVVASLPTKNFGEREATTGNASAVRRLFPGWNFRKGKFWSL